jgi:hypothetical protein
MMSEVISFIADRMWVTVHVLHNAVCHMKALFARWDFIATGLQTA